MTHVNTALKKARGPRKIRESSLYGGLPFLSFGQVNNTAAKTARTVALRVRTRTESNS